MSEIEKAVEVKLETLREEILRNKQEISQNDKRVMERTNEYEANNLSGMTREAERLTRLSEDMEQHRIQQGQAVGTVDTRLEVTMARSTSPKMDRLDDALKKRDRMNSRVASQPRT